MGCFMDWSVTSKWLSVVGNSEFSHETINNVYEVYGDWVMRNSHRPSNDNLDDWGIDKGGKFGWEILCRLYF